MKKFRVIKEKEEWSRQLTNYKTDWCHTWCFHKIASKNNEGKPILFVMDDFLLNESIAIPLLVRSIPGTQKYKDLTSVYGYPGFLFSNHNASKLYNDFIDELHTWSKQNNVISIFSRLNSLLTIPKNLKNIFPIGETIIIELQTEESTQISNYRSVFRNLLRRLEKNNFEVNWSNSINSMKDFINIYRKNMKNLNVDKYYNFSDSYFDDLFNCEDINYRIYHVKLSNQTVCSGIFIFNGEIVQYHLSGALSEYRKYSPTIMLIDKVRKDANSLGFKFLHLGGGLANKKDSLFHFKSGFSKQVKKFYVFKMITNDFVYKKLSNLSPDNSIINENFFPLYRSLNKN